MSREFRYPDNARLQRCRGQAHRCAPGGQVVRRNLVVISYVGRRSGKTFTNR